MAAEQQGDVECGLADVDADDVHEPSMVNLAHLPLAFLVIRLSSKAGAPHTVQPQGGRCGGAQSPLRAHPPQGNTGSPPRCLQWPSQTSPPTYKRLPFLTALAPSERYANSRRRRHKKLTDWGRQLLLQTARWLPDRQIIGVADSSYAAIDLLNAVRGRVCMITRLRLDARLFDPPARRRPGTMGRPWVIGTRQASLADRLTNSKTRWRRVKVIGWYGRGERTVEILSGTALWHHPGRLVPIRYVMVRDVTGELRPQAFLCTDLKADPVDILRWFVRRWSIEVTFAEVRRHLGVETQRQWSDPAIARTTPALLGLFSLVTLWAHELRAGQALPSRAAAWYPKPLPTFSDALALVRRELWTRPGFDIFLDGPRLIEMPRSAINALIEAACYAA